MSGYFRVVLWSGTARGEMCLYLSPGPHRRAFSLCTDRRVRKKIVETKIKYNSVRYPGARSDRMLVRDPKEQPLVLPTRAGRRQMMLCASRGPPASQPSCPANQWQLKGGLGLLLQRGRADASAALSAREEFVQLDWLQHGQRRCSSLMQQQKVPQTAFEHMPSCVILRLWLVRMCRSWLTSRRLL